MKLRITKRQDSGTFGGSKFVLTAYVDLSEEEKTLIKKYKANDILLMSKKVNTFLTGSKEVAIKVSDLITGHDFSSREFMDIINYETEVVEACKGLHAIINELRNFRSVRVIDFEDDNDE